MKPDPDVDIFNGVYDDTDASSGMTSMDSGLGLDSDSTFTRPRMGAEPTKIGRDRDTGEFTGPDMGGVPVPVERDTDTGEFGADPYAVGNFGAFNSPYKTTKEDE